MSAAERDAHRPENAILQLALRRVLASNTFSRSERLRAFLSYVVETEMQNGGAQLKGYTIAVDVFGRPAAFDADGDPLVRVHAGKLRKLLGVYYETEGAGEEWRIFIPKGSYIPEYHRQKLAVPAETAAPGEADDTARPAYPAKPQAAPRRMAIRPRRSWLPAPISSHFALLSVLPLLIVAPLAAPAMSVNAGFDAAAAINGRQLERTQDLPQVTVSGRLPRHSLPTRFADTFRNAASHFRTVTTPATRLRSTQLSFTVIVSEDEEANGVKICIVNDLTADSVFTTVIDGGRLEDESDLLFESVSLANRVLTLDGEIYRYARIQGLESSLMNCMSLTEIYRREQTKDAFRDARKCQDTLPVDRRNALQFIVSAGALPASLER